MNSTIYKTMSAAVLGVLSTFSTATAAPVNLQFVFHLDAGMAEQDVFVEKAEGQVFRITADDTDMTKPVFAATHAVPHNPFDPATNGPFDKGADLSVSVGQWLGASGSGTYECQGEIGEIGLGFEGLIPDGVYTMWYFFMPMPPTQPFGGTIDLPYGARDGADATFVADAVGNARFDRTIEGCLQLSGEQLLAGLAIAYHSDGLTHGGSPGDFGLNSHIQLMTMLPKSLPWARSPKSLCPQFAISRKLSTSMRALYEETEQCVPSHGPTRQELCRRCWACFEPGAD